MADGRCLQIAQILDECRNSYAVHRRKIKELSVIRLSSSSDFTICFTKALHPLFNSSRRTTSADRIIRFVSIFASRRDEKNPAMSDCFLEEFMHFLLTASNASSKNARLRSCQIISEIIMRLPDDAEVSNDIWDKVIDSMKQGVEDKISSVRCYAARALARFASDSENGGDIVELFLQVLSREQNPEVRKAIVLSLPPSNATSAAIIERTLDVSETVRKAAYNVLANRFPLQRLSIKQRTTILQHGLADRSSSVRKECLNLLKDEWLLKGCGGDPVVLLRFLDVETYELVGESVMKALLKTGMFNAQSAQSIRHFLATNADCNEGKNIKINKYMDAETAFYWKSICQHLQSEAHAKGTDAATTGGTEAAVYAAEASEHNELLEIILPSTVEEYVRLVTAHLDAGASYRFTSRQLLLLGAMLDFSDATNRKIASGFIQELLHRPLEHEVEDGSKVLIGDGINLGGEKDWAQAVSELAKKVHAAVGEFDEVVTSVVEELALPCRERTADFLQWMHCLAVTALLLENVVSVRNLKGKTAAGNDLLHSLLIPAAKHAHMDVQRAATRCLGLYGLKEKKLNKDLVKQLRVSFLTGLSQVKVMAAKALFDLAMWYGPQNVDRIIEVDPPSYDGREIFTSVNLADLRDDPLVGLLDLLYSVLDRNDWSDCTDVDNEMVEVIAEGFAKILLLSRNYPSISFGLQPLILAKLIKLYFSSETKDMIKLKQCLSVFFEHYPALSSDHKKCISRAFIPVMRSMWPGVYGNPGGAPIVVSSLRKRAIQASQFMVQMMQIPLYSTEVKEDQSCKDTHEAADALSQTIDDLESRQEGLAFRIATEVISYPMKKTPAAKAYLCALCKLVLLLKFEPLEQMVVKCMRKLLTCMMGSALPDKELARELKQMGEQLQLLDAQPDEEQSEMDIHHILGKLGLQVNFHPEVASTPMPIPPTPAVRSTRTTRARRRLKQEVSSDDEDTSSVCSAVPPSAINTRSQRASKTVAMSRITGDKGDAAIEREGSEEYDDFSENEDDSDVTSLGASDLSEFDN